MLDNGHIITELDPKALPTLITAMQVKTVELKAKQITHPQYHTILPIDELTYKWDRVDNWIVYADSQGINYKKLFLKLTLLLS